ncbi:GRP family sugar transporter [Entomomonas asaccharolytica]|uniref:Glucose transporter GlcU n=1 Tax=Entomomonas asaccharolytica TaxID=2785331 RepID=A0A974NF02_9GAMM|nr:GRP family sugar transporter [Entomomonas asaccharolytica]QQP85571.1 glucose transporter GlcU [Entomomonas asaccharolytica]
MNNILIALIPAVFWGLVPLIVSKMGGKPTNQILGTTIGALIVAIGVYVVVQPSMAQSVLIGGFLSGLAWSFGQFYQYSAFTKIGVSKAMPISTGLQIVSASLFGVIFFKEWAGTTVKIIGASAILIIIIGIFLTAYKKDKDEESSKNMVSGLIILLVSTIGYLGYAVLPRVFDIEGWSGFLPQALGMVLMACILSIKDLKTVITEKTTWKNLLTGFAFAIAAIAYLISASRNGVATGFTLSQMSVVISTLGGIFLLHEHKHGRELVATIMGLALIVAGGIMIGMMK